MRIKSKVRELSNAKVSYVSLVTRGANRIPFRLIKTSKEQDGMIDLSSLKSIFSPVKKAALDTPRITAVVIKKDANLADKLQEISKAGLRTDNVLELEDGTILVSQEADSQIGAVIVKMGDNSFLLVKGMYSYTTPSFNDLVNTQGFYPNVDTATSSLKQICFDAVGAMHLSQEDAQKVISDALKDFSSYIESLVSIIPKDVFKLESALEKLSIKEATVQEVETLAIEKSEDTATLVQDAEPNIKGEMVRVEPVTDNQEIRLLKSEIDSLKTDLAALISTVTGLTASVGAVTKATADVNSKLVETATKADAAVNALKTSLVVAAKGEDLPTPSVKKADTDPRTGCFDTAFSRR